MEESPWCRSFIVVVVVVVVVEQRGRSLIELWICCAFLETFQSQVSRHWQAVKENEKKKERTEKKQTKLTRKAHLKISKVSVDFLIFVLMAVPDSLLVLTPSALDDLKKKWFQQRDVISRSRVGRTIVSEFFLSRAAKCFIKYWEIKLFGLPLPTLDEREEWAGRWEKHWWEREEATTTRRRDKLNRIVYCVKRKKSHRRVLSVGHRDVCSFVFVSISLHREYVEYGDMAERRKWNDQERWWRKSHPFFIDSPLSSRWTTSLSSFCLLHSTKLSN